MGANCSDIQLEGGIFGNGKSKMDDMNFSEPTESEDRIYTAHRRSIKKYSKQSKSESSKKANRANNSDSCSKGGHKRVKGSKAIMITKCDKKPKLVKILPSKSAEKQSHQKNLDKISNRSHKSLSTKNIQKESEVDDRFDATIRIDSENSNFPLNILKDGIINLKIKVKSADEELENEKCKNESATQPDLVEQKLKHEEVKSYSHGPMTGHTATEKNIRKKECEQFESDESEHSVEVEGATSDEENEDEKSLQSSVSENNEAHNALDCVNKDSDMHIVKLEKGTGGKIDCISIASMDGAEQQPEMYKIKKVGGSSLSKNGNRCEVYVTL